MSDFGNAGKLVIRADKLAVKVGAADSLLFTLTFKGASAIFTFSCEHKTWLTEKSEFPSPVPPYRWDWTCAGACAGSSDQYLLRMLFLKAISYTYKVVRLDEGGKEVEVVKDLDASSTDSSDRYDSSLRIFPQ